MHLLICPDTAALPSQSLLADGHDSPAVWAKVLYVLTAHHIVVMLPRQPKTRGPPKEPHPLGDGHSTALGFAVQQQLVLPISNAVPDGKAMLMACPRILQASPCHQSPHTHPSKSSLLLVPDKGQSPSTFPLIAHIFPAPEITSSQVESGSLYFFRKTFTS